MAEQGAGLSEPSAAVSWFYEAEGGRRAGPFSAHLMREFLRHGTISLETRVWNDAFGQAWKPAWETDLAPVHEKPPPPPPAARVNNTLAWLLALVPILGTLGEKALGDRLNGVSPYVLFLPYGLAYTALALVDAGWIERSGRNTRGIKLAIWFWLTPVYLIQRARALKGSFGYFWLWTGSMAGLILIAVPDILSGNTYWGMGVPACNSSFAAGQVRTTFARIPMMQRAGIQAVAVQDARETSSTSTDRRCLASALATNGIRYTVSYTIELRHDQILTNLSIVP